MPEAVVDDLEIVNVAKEQCSARTIPSISAQLLLECIAARQFGQWVQALHPEQRIASPASSLEKELEKSALESGSHRWRLAQSKS
jgi:hypothetical protein